MWIRDLEKLTIPQVVKKFPAFYVTRKFITAFKSQSSVLIVSRSNPIHAPHPTFETLL
jgi:hypothetical protein